METSKFITYFRKKLEKETEDIKNAFAEGRITKENHDVTIGELKGLRMAKSLLQESAKYIEDDDNEI